MAGHGTNLSHSQVPTSKEFEQLLNVTATVSTVLQYLAGSSMCVGFIRKRTTGEASCLPFVAGAVNCAAWFKYGVLIGQPAMQVVNLIGLLILCSCTLIFYKFTLRRINVLKHAVFAGGFLLTLHVMITVLKKEGEEGDRQEKAIVGYLAAVLAVIFCAAPLANLGQVFRSRCTSSLPLGLILMMFIVAAQWSLLGAIIADNFVYYPNLLGSILTGLQLSLFLVFPSYTSGSEKKMEPTDEQLI